MVQTVEAYIGEYASGKSENAVNRAITLHKQGLEVTLVDLDTVEPCYTLRPIKRELEAMGIHVVAWETSETEGLGEAGCTIKGEMRWILRRPGNIIMDVGYGVHGAAIFNMIEGTWENPWLKIYVVLNASRPMTSKVDWIVEYVRGLGRVDGIINNTHLAEETTVETVNYGTKIICEAASILEIPVVATSVVQELAVQIGDKDCKGNPIWPLYRYMPKAFW